MSENGANLGFEEKLWRAADKLRSNMDAAEYKHVVLGLIFLKYISDSFEEKRKQHGSNTLPLYGSIISTSSLTMHFGV